MKQTKIDLTTSPSGLRLARGLELLPGPCGQTLLFVGHRRIYLRISDAGAELIRLLTTRDSDADLLATIQVSLPERARARTTEFVDKLIQAGAIVDAKEYAKVDRRRPYWIAWNPGGPLPLRLRLFCPDRVLCQPMVAWLRSAGQSTRLALLLAMALLICACLANTIAGPPVHWQALPWGIVITALAIHVVLHECSHALACSLSNVKIRDIGIAILYWFLPVAYIDRTDSYRLRQPWQRLSIPIAGPLFDACAAGFTAIIALSISGEAHATMEAISSLQALLFLANLNPLLPTDGFHALEALTGRSNTRRRAFCALLSQLGVLSLPPHLRALTRLEQRVYAIYGFVAAAYVAILSSVAVVQSLRIAQFVVEHSR